jgi:catechol 2,3-dioxygenase-like lactoylglutathione lyase family enzyme
VEDAVDAGHRRANAVTVGDIAGPLVDPERAELRDLPPNECDDLVALTAELARERTTDEPGRSCHEVAHQCRPTSGTRLASRDMLGTSKVMSFVATKDSNAAKRFYEDILGPRLLADEPFALVFDANGTALRIQKVKEPVIAPYTALGWMVSDIRATVRELARRGVTFQRYDVMPQDEAGIWTASNGDRVAWFKDPDGNTLSLTQFA